MSPPTRPFDGQRIGISVSSSGEQLSRRGFTEAGVNRFTVRFARALLAEGATLAFALDWREGGLMEAIASIAFDYQLPASSRVSEAPILNLIPWPDTSATEPGLLARLAGVVEVSSAGLPAELRSMEPQARAAGRSAEAWRYLGAWGLDLSQASARRALLRQGSARRTSLRFPWPAARDRRGNESFLIN
jgi:hypothetical protein